MTNSEGNQRSKERKKKRNQANHTSRKRDNCVSKSILVFSQNVRGLCEGKKDFWIRPIRGELTNVKLDFIIELMKRLEIHIYLIQETWLENDWTVTYDSYTIFHHNVPKKAHQRTGVAIILSPLFSKYWKDAGSQEPITINRNDFDGRFIGIKVFLPNLNRKGSIDRKNPKKVVIASVYHPWNEDYEEFNNQLDSALANDVPHGYEIIIGGDINAQIGVCDCDELNDVLGPFGIETRNEKGRDVIQTYQCNNLRFMNACFEHKNNYFTHESNNRERTRSVIDIIAVSRSLAHLVTDCKVVDNGIHSDHSAISMTWNLQSNKPAFNNKL
jgi:exonuclease III